MKSQELFLEYLSAIRHMTDDQFSWLRRRGLDPVTPENRSDWPPCVIDKILVDPAGFYVVDRDCGVPALIIPAADYSFHWEPQDVFDLVAWIPGKPAAYVRTGEAWLLGEDNAMRAASERGTLRLNASPLTWLQEGRTGAVVLDWNQSMRERLRGVHDFEVETEELARSLEWNLANIPPLPAVTVCRVATVPETKPGMDGAASPDEDPDNLFSLFSEMPRIC